jgi:predicted TIM-barrel fold metal-dependent hydrolase
MTTADTDAPLCLPPRAMARLPAVSLPSGSVDTHFHVFDRNAPLNTPRSYTPQIKTLCDWTDFAGTLGIAKGVLIQPSVYGLDNTVLIEALRADPKRLRGIVVIAQDTGTEEIRRLDAFGVRGVRINTRNKGGLSLDAAQTLASRIAPLGWSLQLQISPEQLPDINRMAKELPLPIVIDHLGFMPLGVEESDLHIRHLQALMDRADAFVKVTAPYRLAKDAGYSGFADAVRILAASHGDRLLWGSDWPHTELWDRMPDDADLIEHIQDALGDTDRANRIFTTNAEALFFGR